MKDLRDKVVLVTGASRGIGQYISQEFASKSSKVICVARTMSDGEHPLEGSLQSTVENIRSSGGEATALSANISDFEQCEEGGERPRVQQRRPRRIRGLEGQSRVLHQS